MKKLQRAIRVSSFLLFIGMVIIAVSLAVFVPGTSRGKILMTVILLVLSPLPLFLAAILRKAITACAGQAEQFTSRDPLTMLYNHSTFWELLGDEIERARRQKYSFAIMLVDLDNFKAINDRHGHKAGDAYLLEFSKLLKSALRKVDIAARFGGDNFTAILPICDESQAYIAAKRLLDGLRGRFLLQNDGTATPISVSIGIAVFPDHAKDRENLFLLADSMLNQSKASGKDRLSMPGDGVDIEMLKSAGVKSFFIMDSIKKNQIVPYFQPIVSVNEKKLFAYEVLTRIITPDRVIPAIEFIEAAEGMGAISKIDYMLVEKAFDVVKRSGFQGFLFLNLSPKALLLNEFMPTVQKLMSDYGVEPSQLVFEITERDTVKNLNLLKKAVLDLGEQGFQIAIDDFGSGYSSFQYLRMFKVNYLKIDGEFIRNMTGNGGMEQAIVSNIANLAGALGIKTIAEYVETEAILGNVRTAGIDYAQGYHIQRPLPDLIQ